MMNDDGPAWPTIPLKEETHLPSEEVDPNNLPGGLIGLSWWVPVQGMSLFPSSMLVNWFVVCFACNLMEVFRILGILVVLGILSLFVGPLWI